MNVIINRDERISALAEEYLRRKRRGETVQLAELVESYPELAGELEEYVQVLEMMERSKTAPLRTGPPVLDRIGDYRIEGVLGQGGMGIVCRAVQESLGRRVALKLMRQNNLEAGGRARFQREAQAAARLHHTNIVAVYGVGEEQGQPYLAMQYIEGVGLDRLVRELRQTGSGSTIKLGQETSHGDDTPLQYPEPLPNNLPEPTPSASGDVLAKWIAFWKHDPQEYFRRIALLFAGAADGLAHAHARGVLHRDLKPSNLLVDASDTLWISDFGLAYLSDSTELTQTGYLVGTLRYVPPERLQGDEHVLGDVYSLAATLYEMVTLHPVFAAAHREELIAKITLHEPIPPRQHVLSLPQDLETIILKALAKEVTKRYASASELAEDLRRFVEHRPIRARRLGPAARLVRWSRRNPVTAALTAALFLTLLGGLIVSTNLYWLAEHRREDAEHNFQQAQARGVELAKALRRAEISEGETRQEAVKAQRERMHTHLLNRFFIEEILEQARPDRKGRQATVFETLESAVANIATKFPNDARMRVLLHTAMGEIYRHLGEFHKSRDQHLLALDLLDENQADDPGVMAALHNLALTDIESGKIKEAEVLLKRLLPAYEKRLGADDEKTLRIRDNLGVILEKLGKYDEALPYQQGAYEKVRKLQGEEADATLNAQNNLAFLLIQCKKHDEAAQLFNDLIAKLKRLHPDNHHRILTARTNLINLYFSRREFEKALPIAREIAQAQHKVAGPDDPMTLLYRNNLGTVLSNTPHLAEAEEVLQDTVTRMEKRLPRRNPHLLSAYHNLGCLHFKSKRYLSAETLLRKSLEGRKVVLPAQHSDRLSTVVFLAQTLQQQDRHDDAIPMLREMLTATAKLPRNSLFPLAASRLLALSLIKKKSYPEAEELLLQSAKALEAKDKNPAEWTRNAESLVTLYTLWEKPVQAAEWAKKK